MTAAPPNSPDRPLLIFDGDCGFCTTSAKFAQRRLGLANVEAWQFLDLATLGVTEAECQESVQWVGVDGTVLAAERAVIAALGHVGGVWGVLGRVINLPGVRHLAGWVYRIVARNRHRMPGGTPACQITPKP